MALANIPTIDLSDFGGDPEAHRRLVSLLGDGLTEFGFVTIENHGIDQDLVRAVYDDFEAFFALPDAVKAKYSGIEGGARGFTPFGVEHAKDSAQPDLKEFFHVGQMPPGDHPLAGVYPPNVWPDEVPSLEANASRLYRRLEDVARAVLQASEEVFELERGTFASMMDMGNSILRAIHYPPLTGDVPDGAVRAAAHEDINLITLLCEATESGLELLTRQGEWLEVEALEGQIVADVGDMLSRATNQVLPATTHRVVNPTGAKTSTDRYSIPFFVHPYPSCDLSVMDAFVTEDRPPRFEPITAQEFLDERLREIGLKA
ncbi:MAG: 2-oxoglutarate and iron-dependent oxygenase domain-containing protein [Acidobacteriota bacterium]